MKMIFTRHSKSRMRWRGITQKEVDAVLECPDRKEIIGENKFHYYRALKNRNLRVTCVIEEEEIIVITVVDKSD